MQTVAQHDCTATSDKRVTVPLYSTGIKAIELSRFTSRTSHREEYATLCRKPYSPPTTSHGSVFSKEARVVVTTERNRRTMLKKINQSVRLRYGLIPLKRVQQYTRREIRSKKKKKISKSDYIYTLKQM